MTYWGSRPILLCLLFECVNCETWNSKKFFWLWIWAMNVLLGVQLTFLKFFTSSLVQREYVVVGLKENDPTQA